MISLPENVRLPRAWDTAAAALTACARAFGEARSVGEIAAASGLAFRVSVDAQLSLAGPHAWPWSEELPAAAARLGFACRAIASSEPPGGALHADAQARAIALVDEGLAAGRATMIWGVHAPEFGVVRGGDGEVWEISGILDGAGPTHLRKKELGRGDVPAIFALQLTERIALPADEAALATLRAALVAGRGPAPTLAGFSTGLEAWRAVHAALERGVVDPAGLAYSAQRWAEARAAVCAWLDGAARALALDLDPGLGLAAWRRAAGMLAELAALHPFPPPGGAMLTNDARDQAQALVEEAARAEAAALDAVEAALQTHRRRRADAWKILDLADAPKKDLFACAGDWPVALDEESDACRTRGPLSGKLIYDGERVVGQLLYAPLDESRYPIAADGKRWFIFCPWLARDARGRGLGARLFAALEADARAAGVDGLLTVATGDERFLFAGNLARHSFVEVDRRGDARLLERVLSEQPSRARFVDPDPMPGHLVVVRQAYNCPLLLHTRRALAQVARDAGLTVDERDATAADPARATIAERALVHGYVPAPVLAAALAQLK